MLSKVERHREKCLACNELYAVKNHDYGDSFGETFRKLGIISAATRITDKYNRFINLATGKDQKVADESIKDTLIDLASYAIMTIVEIEEAEAKTNES